MSSANLCYLGHSAICIELPSTKQVLVDPFLTGNPLCDDKSLEFPNLTAILLTHGHPDHVGDTLALAEKYSCTVYANFELASLLAKDGVPTEQLEFMNKGGSLETEEFRVTLEQAFHSSSYDAKDGNTYYAGEAGSIVLEIKNAATVFHAGDTLLYSDLQLIAQRYHPDIALLPIGDRFTMGPKDAAKAAKFLQAKKVIPVHYATFDALSGTPQAFCEAMQDCDSEVSVLKPGDTISL